MTMTDHEILDRAERAAKSVVRRRAATKICCADAIASAGTSAAPRAPSGPRCSRPRYGS